MRVSAKNFWLIAACLLSVSCSGVGYHLHGHDGLQPIYHRVQSGDSIARIASQHGVKVESLLWLNGLRERGHIRVGDLLLVSYNFSHSEHSHDDHDHGATGATGSIPVPEIRRASLGNTRPKPEPKYTSGELFYPVKQGRLVSKFGPRKSSFHDGIDIAASTGTPVYAAHDAEVLYSDDGLRGYGNLIILRSRTGMLSVYAHNKRLYAKEGQKVSRGQKIASVGSTGRSTGPHLHFEVRIRDKKGRYLAVDPIPFFNKEAGPARYRVNESFTPLLANRR